MQIDASNGVNSTILENLGFSTDEDISFDDIMNKEFKVALNDDYYQQVGNYYIPNNNLESVYNAQNSMTIKITAIIRGKEDKVLLTNGSSVYYTSSLVENIIELYVYLLIVEQQQQTDYNIMTGEAFSEDLTKETWLAYLGADSVPVAIYLYPKDFDSKDEIVAYLDAYNENKSSEDQVLYTDMAEMMSTLSGGIMDAITVVLIAFSSISLVVSSIMIAIITYISVLERTKEIGILRALGARGKDITRVFNAETLIIGLCSGLLGLGIAYLLTFPANAVIENLSGLPNVAKLNPIHALILLLISVTLTVLSGFIPAKMASKKDPVVALRTE